MDIKDKAEAAKKATEGKMKEAFGRATDSPEALKEGEAEQKEAAAIDAQDLDKSRSEDAKDPAN
ncbi:MAG: hypothetical protein WA947_07130 [Phormidesmis sp.]